MLDPNERRQLESRGIYPSLFGRSILVIDEGDTEPKHQYELETKQRMRFSFRDTVVLDSYLPIAVGRFGFESTAIHIPVFPDVEIIQEKEEIVRRVREVCPRTILLTGHPVYEETVKSYERLRSAGFHLVPKYDARAIAKTLAGLF